MRVNRNCYNADNSQHNCQQDKHAAQDFFLLNDEKYSEGYENQAVYKKQNDHLLLIIVDNDDENKYI